MIIPLDKLLTYNKNKYIFSRATMEAVEKIGNMRSFPEDDSKWKVVPNILKLMLNNDVKFINYEEPEKEQ
ncbi:MAG TPA: hypothetical protein PLM53_05070 [Spirochaetota bacterium]|nr:hypothetical protein [Spirochaetota bacterium]HPC40601.1 hypothetical protein [Spirochaetota bacterium]HPL18194.1 hypothetical protein [Spirochaetota bacterium]HQF07891.1 hypothetical protein [Spirochaetota bacterium]HQH96450.1 hypothetical protein [Spirochaetota bacterium]